MFEIASDSNENEDLHDTNHTKQVRIANINTKGIELCKLI